MNVIKLSFVVMLLTLASVAHAKTDPIYTSLFSSLAVGGYDVVAYFKEGKQVKGDGDFSIDYKDAQWRFSSEANLAAFTADPESFVPQYGGYCAWAVSQGYTAKGDPDNWTIVDGKLYLNYNDDVQATWEGDIPGFINAANTNWPSLLAE